MKKRFLMLGAASLMCVSALLGVVSCGGGAPTKVDFEVPEEGFDVTKDVEIKFYHTMGKNLQEVFEAFLEVFNAKYPHIKVTHTSVGGYDDVRDQLTTEISSNKVDGASLTYCYPDHVAMYNKAKKVISLDNLIDSKVKVGDEILGLSDEQLDDYVDAYYEEGRGFGDGKMYSLPFSKSSEILYYNKTEFERLNLQVPDHWFSRGSDDVTSMEYACKVLKEAHGDETPLGYDSGANWFITMCEQMNAPYTSALGEHYLFDNDKAKGFVSKFVDWKTKGYVTTKALLGTYTSSAFTEQNLYMCIGSSAGAGYQTPAPEGGKYPFEVGITSIPQEDPVNHPAVIQQGPSVCIFNNKDPQVVMASWLFLKFFTTNPDFQAQFSLSSGYTPVIKSVETNKIYKEEIDKADGNAHIQASAIKQCLAQKDSYFISPAFVGSSVARDQAEKIMTNCLEGNDINTVFKNAIIECKK